MMSLYLFFMTKNCMVVVLGDVGVGKSTCIIRYTQKYFVKEYDPTFENRFKKHVVLDNDVFLLNILDTAGDVEYFIKENYIRNAEGIIFFFSITCRRSFDMISEKYNEVVSFKGTSTFPKVLVGNKCDLERERIISPEEGEELANILNCSYFETSAKEDVNINEVFHHLVTYFKNNETINRNIKL